MKPYALPLGVAEVKRSGSDVTVVAHGHLVVDALTAADELAKEGISLEVVDPRTLSPMDMTTILASVQKTSRAVVVHEAVRACGIGAEIAATIADEAFDYSGCAGKASGSAFYAGTLCTGVRKRIPARRERDCGRSALALRIALAYT